MTGSNRAVLRTSPAYPEHALPPQVHKLERPSALVKARALEFLMFEKSDLDVTAAFLSDFGMQLVVRDSQQLQMRGSGAAPCIYLARRGARSRYLGAAFTVAGEAELVRLESQAGARRLPAGAVPAGGSGVELVDPAGNLLWLICGQLPMVPLPLRPPCTRTPTASLTCRASTPPCVRHWNHPPSPA